MEIKNRMKTSLLLLLTVLVTTSCLKDKDDIEYTYYDDTAVTAFSLGTVNQYVHTIGSKGQDSVYVNKLTGSNYTFYIDQQQKKIWNVDSLPYGTDPAHIITFITAKNSGRIMLRSLNDAESYTSYSSTDSIDFSKERIIRIISQSGNSYRDYDVKVNIRKVKEGTLSWKNVGKVTTFAGMKAIRGTALNGKIYIFAFDGTTTRLFTTEKGDGATWTVSDETLAADAYQNFAVKDGILYLLDNGVLKKLTGTSWETILEDNSLKQLIGASTTALYALDGEGNLLASFDDGGNWQTEPLDDAASLLPSQQITVTTMPFDIGQEANRILLAGYGSASEKALVWTRLTGTGLEHLDDDWTFVDLAGDDRYAIPQWQSLSIVNHEGSFLAMGLTDEGKLDNMLASKDGGITWKTYENYVFPNGFDTNADVFATLVDEDGFLWLITDKMVFRQIKE